MRAGRRSKIKGPSIRTQITYGRCMITILRNGVSDGDTGKKCAQ